VSVGPAQGPDPACDRGGPVRAPRSADRNAARAKERSPGACSPSHWRKNTRRQGQSAADSSGARRGRSPSSDGLHQVGGSCLLPTLQFRVDDKLGCVVLELVVVALGVPQFHVLDVVVVLGDRRRALGFWDRPDPSSVRASEVDS
jgi:hypothetical protein